MSPDPVPIHYYPGAPVARLTDWALPLDVLRYVVDRYPDPEVPDWTALVHDLESERVSRFVGYKLLTGGGDLPPATRQVLRQQVLLGEAEKLSDDSELALIFEAANEQGLPLLLTKGEAMARTLYPAASCRPTGDFDMLIRPTDLGRFQGMFSALGYEGGRFNGQHIFAEQAWMCPAGVRGRPYLVDLHWDLTNRRYFRQRADLDAMFRQAVPVSLEGVDCHLPDTGHMLLIACVHLGAADRGFPVELRWLLDIRLLLDALEEREFDTLVEQARKWRLLDVMLVYCRMADQVLGPCRHGKNIGRLAAGISPSRRKLYKWTCDHRWFDLLEFGVRLRGIGQWPEFLSQILAYRKIKKNL